MSLTSFFEQHAQDSSDVLGQIISRVQLVEEELLQLMTSDVRLVQEVSEHTLKAGGKRLRPAFLSLSAAATGLPFDEARAIRLGACLEMIHMATLIHDDVIDHADTRRGVATASAVFGNTASILSGDVLLAKAMSILAQDGDLGIIRTVSKAVEEMAEGEVLELESRGNFMVSEELHIRILRMKTAAFIECCCQLGGMITDAPAEMQDALATFGHHVGLAFQIVDDLLDFRGDSEKTGKPQATDFREGCATLPLIYLRETLSDDEQNFASRKFGNGVTDDEIRMISGWMENRGAYQQAEETAATHANLAMDALGGLPESKERQLLAAVTKFVLARQA